MGERFEVIEHTADVGIAAYGADLREAFANAARGLFSLMTDIDSVKDDIRYDVEASADNREELLVAWLNELIYLFEVNDVLFNRFDIAELGEAKLKAACYGENIDAQRHKMKLGVKAATYHMMQVEEGDNGCRVQVLFDI
jgi:SHS2 domain-containing protein